LRETITEDVVEDEENPADEETVRAKGRIEPTRLRTTTTYKVTSPSLKTQRRSTSLAELLAR